MVVEDDTHLVLGADPVPRETDEPPDSLLKRAEATEPKLPGSVVVAGSSPVRFHAIVHDLSLEPSWKEEWVVGAIAAVLREAERRKLRSIALPMLGTLHGSLEQRRFIELLEAVLAEVALQDPGDIWLVLSAEADSAALETVQELGWELRGRA